MIFLIKKQNDFTFIKKRNMFKFNSKNTVSDIHYFFVDADSVTKNYHVYYVKKYNSAFYYKNSVIYFWLTSNISNYFSILEKINNSDSNIVNKIEKNIFKNFKTINKSNKEKEIRIFIKFYNIAVYYYIKHKNINLKKNNFLNLFVKYHLYNKTTNSNLELGFDTRMYFLSILSEIRNKIGIKSALLNYILLTYIYASNNDMENYYDIFGHKAFILFTPISRTISGSDNMILLDTIELEYLFRGEEIQCRLELWCALSDKSDFIYTVGSKSIILKSYFDKDIYKNDKFLSSERIKRDDILISILSGKIKMKTLKNFIHFITEGILNEMYIPENVVNLFFQSLLAVSLKNSKDLHLLDTFCLPIDKNLKLEKNTNLKLDEDEIEKEKLNFLYNFNEDRDTGGSISIFDFRMVPYNIIRDIYARDLEHKENLLFHVKLKNFKYIKVNVYKFALSFLDNNSEFIFPIIEYSKDCEFSSKNINFNYKFSILNLKMGLFFSYKIKRKNKFLATYTFYTS